MCLLQLDSGRVEYGFQFNTGESSSLSPMYRLPRGIPHYVDVSRFLTYSRISIDGYGDSYSAVRMGVGNESTEMEPNPKEFYLGAASTSPLQSEDFQGKVLEVFFIFKPVVFMF